jgi:hypothetical protein
VARISTDDQPRNPAGGSSVEAAETFPGVTLWEKFDEACKEAEPIRDLLIEETKRERDLVVKSDPNWRVHSRERINAMAEARCDRKVKAAEAMYHALCKHAEEKLMEALDQREKARGQ